MKATKKSLYEVVRFGLVGVFATILHYGIYWILRLWLNYNIAYTIGYALSFVCNFFLTSYFTFKTEATVKRGLGFGGAHLFNYLLQIFLLNVFVWIGIKQEFAPIIVFSIAIPIQFVLIKYIFKK